MSVSVSESGNSDLNAIVSGGDAFMARMKALKDAKAEHDAALGNLRLGHDVVRAMQDVQAREQAVIDTTESAKHQAAKTIGDANAQAEGIISAANDQAAQVKAQSKSDADNLAREVNEARSALEAWSAKTKSDASQTMNDALAAKAEADQHMARAQQTHTEAQALLAQAKAKHDHADRRHADLDAWLAQRPRG